MWMVVLEIQLNTWLKQILSQIYKLDYILDFSAPAIDVF